MISPSTMPVLHEVALERERQDAKWGPQNHPILPPDKTVGVIRRDHEGKANMWKGLNDSRVKDRRIAWDGILLEEAHEAFAEEDPAKIREEMIQVAAVAVAIIEYLDRENG